MTIGGAGVGALTGSLMVVVRSEDGGGAITGGAGAGAGAGAAGRALHNAGKSSRETSTSISPRAPA
jgi:hypothetical protein